MKKEQELLNEICALVKVNFFNKGRYKYLAHTLNNIIEDNEEIKIICSGIYNNKQLEVLCTSKRILMVNSGIVPQRHEISIEKIEGLSLEGKGLSTNLHIIIGGKEFILQAVNNCQEFMNVVHEQMNNYKSLKININNTVEKDISDKIEKLSQLYKDGVLTEYEFNMKKMELLDKVK